MSKPESPITTFTRKLKEHKAFRDCPNKSMVYLIYLKLLLSEPFRIIERKKYREKYTKTAPGRSPVFIIGHWRSGTSFLQYLLAEDPQFGYMNKFQVAFPDIFLSSEQMLKSIVDRIPDSLPLIQDAQNMSINLELDSPSEIEIALTTMISPASLHWGHIFPKNAWAYFNKYLFFDTAQQSDIDRWKQDYRYLIQKTSLANNGRRLLIKSPGNTSRITKLLEMYPKAKFIFIHRNPYDVFYSSKKLWNTLLDNLAIQDFEEQSIENEIINVYKKLMQRYLEQRSQIPTKQWAEIRFADFISDPVEQLSQIYSILELPYFETARPKFNHFLQKKQQGKSSNYNYENRIIKQINKHWEFAFHEWNYSLSTANK